MNQNLGVFSTRDKALMRYLNHTTGMTYGDDYSIVINPPQPTSHTQFAVVMNDTTTRLIYAYYKARKELEMPRAIAQAFARLPKEVKSND